MSTHDSQPFIKSLPEELTMAYLAAIVTSSDDAIISKTLDGTITSWNTAAERIFGYTAEEAIGQPITILIPEDRLQEEPAILERLQRGERVDHFETQRITRHKKLLDISLTISPIKDSTGKIIGASKIARDITGQKETERINRENEERFRMAVESTRLGTWEYNLLDGELVWSLECRKIYNVPDDLPINFELFKAHIFADDRQLVQDAIERALDPAGNGAYDIQYRIIRYGDRLVRWIRAQGKVYFYRNNRPGRFIGTVLDITDEKMAQAELERMVGERTVALKKTNEELEQYAYIASHDLQEPLRKIQTFAELLKENANDPEALEKYYEKINASARRMSSLIKDVLNYSRLSQVDTIQETVNLDQLLQEIITDFELLIAQKKAVITAGPLPVIKGDSQQLRQLFGNLFSNSLKFCERIPHIQISATTVPGTPYVQILFKDNGIGFEQQYADQIFIAFKRLNNRQLYSGTGIGMALCKKIVERHGGTIRADSEVGKGTVFTILLPVG
jgi:PAS domain S-box-containing protein